MVIVNDNKLSSFVNKLIVFTLNARVQSNTNNPHVAIGARWSICCDNWFNYQEIQGC